MGTSSGRTWATRCTSQDCCCQNPCPRSSPLPTQVSAETLKHSPAGLAQSPVEVTAPFPWVLVRTSFCLCLQESLVGTGFDFNMTVPVLPSCLDFSFVLGHEEPFLFWWVTWLFSSCVLTGEDEHVPFYSAVLIWEDKHSERFTMKNLLTTLMEASKFQDHQGESAIQTKAVGSVPVWSKGLKTRTQK